MDVKGDAHRVGPLLSREAQKRCEEAEYGVGVQPVPGSQRPDAVIGPVDHTVAVNGHQFHGESSWANDSYRLY